MPNYGNNNWSQQNMQQMAANLMQQPFLPTMPMMPMQQRMPMTMQMPMQQFAGMGMQLPMQQQQQMQQQNMGMPYCIPTNFMQQGRFM